MSRWLYRAALSLGVLVRLAACIIAGNGIGTPWSSGVDAPYYATLASNIATGMGFAYAHLPTAFRAPLYPLFLAAILRIFPAHAFLLARLIQFAVGLLTVYLCGRLAEKLFGDRARPAAVLLALFLPTLAVYPTELMTECLAALLACLLFYLLLLPSHRSGDIRTAVLAGLIIGIATLQRFNMALLGVVAIWIIFRSAAWQRRWHSMAICTVVAAAIVSPWLIRNQVVFHGQVLFSTEGGFNALVSLRQPAGPRSPADDEANQRALGVSGLSLERNGPERLSLPSEAELDRRFWALTRQQWKEHTWAALSLVPRKLACFWLSAEHLSALSTFPPKLRLVRVAGLFFYWGTLILATFGWIFLRRRHPETASFLLGYSILVTLAHVPFTMNTRIRVPFIDPLLASLAAGALVHFRERLSPGKVGAETNEKA